MEQLANPSTAAVVAELGSAATGQYAGSAGAYLVVGFITGAVGTVLIKKAIKLAIFVVSVSIVALFAGTQLEIVETDPGELLQAAQSSITVPRVPAEVVEMFTVLPFVAGIAIGVAVTFSEL
jgi:uncharacterized membrane protein (Fun14 family)